MNSNVEICLAYTQAEFVMERQTVMTTPMKKIALVNMIFHVLFIT